MHHNKCRHRPEPLVLLTVAGATWWALGCADPYAAGNVPPTIRAVVIALLHHRAPLTDTRT
ncbi:MULTISPECIES: hypothetical protein [unclassified Streptomyces]|uniref:hypothetical protein n=1 Tax=unclassified Streptomyces TaxID=2593676 RepID=UPI0036641579